jgi:hypothetical protein
MSKFIPVVAMIVTIGIAALNIWAAIKIKFAPDAATVILELKSMALRILAWAMNLASAAIIVWFFTSSRPVDRLFIFAVVLNSFFLFYSFVIHWVKRILGMIIDLHKIDERILDIIGALNVNDSSIIEVISALRAKSP